MLNTPPKAHTRDREQEWKKKKSVLEQTCISFPWDEHEKKKKKKGKPAAHSSHSLQALSPWRQHKDILFCFASFLILSKRDEGRKKLCSRAPTRWTRLWFAPRDSLVTSEEDFNVWLWVFFRNTTKPWSQMKTRIDEHRWLNSSSAPENLVFQYLLNKHFLVCSIVNKNCLLGCIQVFHDDTRPSLES